MYVEIYLTFATTICLAYLPRKTIVTSALRPCFPVAFRLVAYVHFHPWGIKWEIIVSVHG